MERLLKCYGWCEKEYSRKDLTKYNKKNYCAKCLERKKFDDVGRAKLYEQIRKSFKIGEPTGVMYSNSKNYREKQGYTYQDQAKAIWYADVILKKEMNEKYHLGIIPYVIKDAVKFYDEQKARIEAEKIKEKEKEEAQEEIEIEEDQQENIKTPKLFKCYGGCNKKYTKENLIKYKSQNHCKECVIRKKQDEPGRLQLIDQIKKSFKIKFPTKFMLKQAKEFREKNGFLYEHQALAIKYADEVEKMPMSVNYGIGIVQIHVQTAVKYYAQEQEKEERLPDFMAPAKTQTVKINKPHHKKFVNPRLVDMNDLLN